jgi:glycosyltransferase involved in cell wall biosynthesis
MLKPAVQTMRALHLIPGNLYGGVESFLTLIARRRELTPQVEHHFALCFDGRLGDELGAAGVPVHQLGAMRTSRPWTVLRGRRRLSALLATTRFDVALTHSSWPQAMFAPVLARAGVPTVFYLHGPLLGISWLDRWAGLHRPTTMIGVSRHTLDTGRQLYPTLEAHVLNYPITWQGPPDGAHVREAVRAELGADPGDVVLLQASRADRWKGHDQLISALERIKDLPGWRLWLAGGAQRPKERTFLSELGRQVSRAGLDERVRFLGERRDVPRLLAGADLYVQANRAPEGFSLVFIEAFAAGVPIVTMRLGGATEIIDDTCGALVAPGDIAGFAHTLRELIPATERRQAMGARARTRVVELCDPAARLLDLERVLAETAARGPTERSGRSPSRRDDPAPLAARNR